MFDGSILCNIEMSQHNGMNSIKVDNNSFSCIREAIIIFHQQCRFPLTAVRHIELRMVKDHTWRYRPQLTKF